MKIKLKPYDMLFFRNSKPFRKGEDTWADSMALPNLTTIYGALRSCYFAEHPDEIILANKNNDPTRNLIINQICYLYDGNEILYPAPKDLAMKKNISRADKFEMEKRKKYKTVKLKCKEFKDIYCSLKKDNNIEHFFTSETEVEEVPMGLISKDEFLYYSCNYEEVCLRSLKDMFISEEKIGIAREDSKRSTQKSMLYRISQVRYEKLEIIVDFDGLDIPKEGFLKLGGKGNFTYKELSQDISEKVGALIFPDMLEKYAKGERMPFVGTIKILAKYAKVRDSFFYRYNTPETYEKEKELYLLELSQQKEAEKTEENSNMLDVFDDELKRWLIKESSLPYIKLAKEIQEAGLPVEVLKPLVESIKSNNSKISD
jgi:CRISPR type III-B/RAMP module-associated protein Cmr3